MTCYLSLSDATMMGMTTTAKREATILKGRIRNAYPQERPELEARLAKLERGNMGKDFFTEAMEQYQSNTPGDPNGVALSNLEETLIEYLGLYVSETEEIVKAIRPILDAVDDAIDRAMIHKGGK